MLFKTIQNYMLFLLSFTLVFLISFHLPLFADSLLFYRGIKLCILSFLASLVLDAMLFRSRAAFSFESLLAAHIAAASLHLVFFVVVPVTLDRSVSTHILQTVERAGAQGLSFEEIKSEFIGNYIEAKDAVSRRLSEQMVSKNIEKQGERYVLTEQGHKFLNFARPVSQLYGVEFPQHN